MTSVLITGATRGLGLATARAAAGRGAEPIVAGRDPAATARVAADVGGRPLELDLGSFDSVRRAVAGAPEDVDVLVCNAGLQITSGTTRTVDGFEETFQVNVLGHVALVDALLARRRPPRRLVWLGSSTHDPSARTGMPAPGDGPVDGFARPAAEPAGRAGEEGRRRYTTSKLLTTALAGAYAREHPEVHVVCFDPGLMPGTGLARDYRPVQRWLWGSVMRALVLLPFASTPNRSARALTAVALDEPPPGRPGEVVDHRLRTGTRSARAADPTFQQEVLHRCRDLLAGHGVTAA